MAHYFIMEQTATSEMTENILLPFLFIRNMLYCILHYNLFLINRSGGSIKLSVSMREQLH